MQANELRIGNWVLPAYEVEFNPIQIDSLFKGAEPACVPIPLTPDILEKAGFDVSFWGYNKAGFPFSIWHYEGKEEMLVQYNKTEEEICYVTYLHELQNLYHAITGKELEIDL